MTARLMFRDGAPGELQPLRMLVDRSNERVDVTAAVPELKKFDLFLRLHRRQIRVGIEKLVESGSEFLGIQLLEIGEGQIVFAKGEPPDDGARRGIAQIGGKHDVAKNILALGPGTAERFAPGNFREVRPALEPDEAFL